MCSHAAIYDHDISARPVDKTLGFVHAPSLSLMVESEHISRAPMRMWKDRRIGGYKIKFIQICKFHFLMLTCPFAHITCIKSSVIL